jgi:FkbM family methyltransferase
MNSNRLNSVVLDRLIHRLSKSKKNLSTSFFIDSEIYIYGAGDLGALAIEYCEACGIKILGVLDQTREGFISGRAFNYRIYKPYEVSLFDRKKYPVFVAVATVPFTPISEILSALDWSNIYPFYSMTTLANDAHPLSNGWEVGNVNSEELEGVRWVGNNWSDATSLNHYEAFLAWHIDCSELPIGDGSISPNQRYTIEPLISRLSRNKKQMIDVGSHEGESVKRLLDAGICFAEYVLIEPDSKSQKKLRQNIQKYLPSSATVKYKEVIISSNNEFMGFEEGLGYCSQLWSQSKNIRPTLTLDSLKLKPDFIKIHTEGSELDILKGANKTIKEYKPSLAYSVYHNRDGLYRAIIEPMRSLDNYRWYFRLHSYQGTGAFVYGVPN